MAKYKCVDLETKQIVNLSNDLDQIETILKEKWNSQDLYKRVGYIFIMKDGKKYQWLKMNDKLINKDLNHVLWG